MKLKYILCKLIGKNIIFDVIERRYFTEKEYNEHLDKFVRTMRELCGMALTKNGNLTINEKRFQLGLKPL